VGGRKARAQPVQQDLRKGGVFGLQGLNNPFNASYRDPNYYFFYVSGRLTKVGAYYDIRTIRLGTAAINTSYWLGGTDSFQGPPMKATVFARCVTVSDECAPDFRTVTGRTWVRHKHTQQGHTVFPLLASTPDLARNVLKHRYTWQAEGLARRYLGWRRLQKHAVVHVQQYM
jgi:hypothetical protein